MASDLFEPARHGDADAEYGVTDFAVNVQPGPPEFVRAALAARLGDLAAYPTRADTERAVSVIAARYGRRPEEVLLLDGAAEGFELLVRLAPAHIALIEPSFTEPDRVLRATGAPISRVILRAPWTLDTARIPDEADLVVVGNPTNPTSVLHSREQILALAAPGRLVVVDEAFADLTRDPATGEREPQSLAELLPDGVIVIRSATKTFGLAGLRIGYLLAAPEVIARLTAGRRHWPLGTLALTALAECLGPEGDSYADSLAARLATDRDRLRGLLVAAGFEVCAAPTAPYVLIRVDDGLGMKAALRERGFGVRSCANFVGLGPDHLRIAVRSAVESSSLVAAMTQIAAGNPATAQGGQG